MTLHASFWAGPDDAPPSSCPCGDEPVCDCGLCRFCAYRTGSDCPHEICITCNAVDVELCSHAMCAFCTCDECRADLDIAEREAREAQRERWAAMLEDKGDEMREGRI